MGAQRRKISQQERKERDALMRVVNWVTVTIIRRLFDDGWTTEEVALQFVKIQKEIGNRAGAASTLNWNYVDDAKLADEVYAAFRAGG